MPPFRETYKIFFPSLIPLVAIWVGYLASNNQAILYTFYFVGLFLIVWGVGIVYSIRRPRVWIRNVQDRWFAVSPQSISFKIITTENNLYLENNMIVTGFIPNIVSGKHNKKKITYNYLIKEKDTEIKSQERNMEAVAQFPDDSLRGFLHFKTLKFNFIGGAKKNLIYIHSTKDEPISVLKYWYVVFNYLVFNKVAGIDYWRDKDSQAEQPNNSPIDHT